MRIADKVARIERSLEGLASRRNVARQPIEIRSAVLDAIENLVEPAGGSRRVFPFNQVTVEIVAATAAARAAVTAVLDSAGGLQAAVARRLSEAGAEPPADLDVEVKLVRAAGKAWAEGSAFRVACERRQAVPTTPSASAPGHRELAQIVVLTGKTTRKQYALTGERINVGRMAAVLDRERRVVRRNQIVFLDCEDPANQTVSRAQAHLVFVPPAGFQLFDDRSSYGTRVFRGGRTITVEGGSPKGVRLRPGDEIYFGQALVRFELISAPSPRT